MVLKLVDHDDQHRYYTWWTMAGRHGADEVAVSYQYTGEDTIRLDLPHGVELSRDVLKKYLGDFLKKEGELEGKPPDIIP